MSLPAGSPLSIIVTADDFGIGRRTSEGIIQAHLHGPVTATSLMAITGEHVRASIPLLADTPNLDVGLHIVLTDCGEKPVVARPSSGLVDRDGRFFSNGKLWQRAFFGKLDRHAIADEIARQARLFVELLGRPPAYVDCHHHAHQLPIIRDALVDVIEDHLLPPITRITAEPRGMLGAVPSVRLKRGIAHRLGTRAEEIFHQSGLWTNDFYFGMLAPRDLKRIFPWEKYVQHLPKSGIIEWIVHPGLADESLNGRDGYRLERLVELEALTGSAGRGFWEHLRPVLSRKSVLSQGQKAI